MPDIELQVVRGHDAIGHWIEDFFSARRIVEFELSRDSSGRRPQIVIMIAILLALLLIEIRCGNRHIGEIGKRERNRLNIREQKRARRIVRLRYRIRMKIAADRDEIARAIHHHLHFIFEDGHTLHNLTKNDDHGAAACIVHMAHHCRIQS